MKENIERLLNNESISNYRISKDTGIAQSTLNDYTKKEGKSKIGNMKLDHAITLNNYYLKETMKMTTTWEFEGYSVHDEQEVLRFENNEGDTIGYVALHDHRDQLIDDLNNGANPIADGWEDGSGNTIDIEGWE